MLAALLEELVQNPNEEGDRNDGDDNHKDQDHDHPDVTQRLARIPRINLQTEVP